MIVATVWKHTEWLVKCVETSIRHLSVRADLAPVSGSACASSEQVTQLPLAL